MDTQVQEEGSEQSSGTSAEVPEPDTIASGDAGTVQENTAKKEEGQESPSSRLVDRKTGLRCLSIGLGRIGQSTIRKRTERDLRLPDAEIPYIKTEKAVRDLVCSLMERQDRMNEAIFLKLNDLEYRVADVEQGRKTRVRKRSDADKDVRK